VVLGAVHTLLSQFTVRLITQFAVCANIYFYATYISVLTKAPCHPAEIIQFWSGDRISVPAQAQFTFRITSVGNHTAETLQPK
jgi:hypothetical protein